jgi:hypothetical protein
MTAKKRSRKIKLEVWQSQLTMRWHWRLRACNGKIKASNQNNGYVSYRASLNAGWDILDLSRNDVILRI